MWVKGTTAPGTTMSVTDRGIAFARKGSWNLGQWVPIPAKPPETPVGVSPPALLVELAALASAAVGIIIAREIEGGEPGRQISWWGRVEDLRGPLLPIMTRPGKCGPSRSLPVE